MSGFMPFFNKRRNFIKQSLGLIALTALNPLKLFANNTKKENKNDTDHSKIGSVQ
jgi:hypothetical protein